MFDYFKNRWYIIPGSIILCLIAATCYAFLTASVYRVSTTLYTNKSNKQFLAAIKNEDLLSKLKPKQTQNNDGSSYDAESHNEILIKRYTDSGDKIQLIISTTDPQKTKEDIDNILARYNSSYKNGLYWDSLGILRQQRKVLLDKIEQLSAKPNSLHNKINTDNEALYKKQESIFEYILSYVKRPADSFVIIPDSFDPQSPQLQIFITEFNDLEYRRQELLNLKANNQASLERINKQLSAIKNNIYNEISIRRNEIIKSRLAQQSLVKSATDGVSTSKQTLSEIKNQLLKLQTRINFYAKKSNDVAYQQAKQHIKRTRLITRPIINLSADGFLYAMLFGLIFPVIVIYISRLRSSRNGPITYKSIKKMQQLGEFKEVSNQNKLAHYTSIANTLTSILNNTKDIGNNSKLISVTATDDNATPFILDLANAFVSAGKRTVLIDYNLQAPQILEQINTKYTYGLKSYIEDDAAIVPLHKLLITSALFRNLFLIGAGPVNDDGKEILSFLNILEDSWDNTSQVTSGRVFDKKISDLITALKQQFDCIILQTPQLDQQLENDLIYGLADASIFLVKAGESYNVKIRSAITTS